MTTRTGQYRLVLPCLFSAIALAAGCSPAAQADKRSDSGTASTTADQALPDPWYELEGRKLLIKLPYRGEDWHMWGGDMEGTGPFVFKTLDVIPRGGPAGTDLAVFEYEATGPGTGHFSFGLTQVSEDGPTPPEQRRMGLSKATYKPVIDVK